MSAQRLRVLVVDDEAPARTRLKDLLGECAGAVVIGEAASAREALEQVLAAPVDLVLLDICMPELDGIELAQHLQKLPQAPAIVFTTAYDHYAVHAFEVHAIDYLLKPVRLPRLVEALARVHRARAPGAEALRQAAGRAPAFFSAHERGRIHLIALEDVLYLKAELKYVTVRTAEREYLIEDTLARIEQDYPEIFVRLHRNCLVARAALRGFERADGGADGQWLARLEGCEEKIAVSRRQAHVVRQFARRIG
jgi:two-component system, LytTR family, response regulator AlgR